MPMYLSLGMMPVIHNRNIDTMYQATEYIEQHLMDHISIDDVASEVGYSLFHFSRLFNQYIGHSPYDYLIRRRLTEAAKVIMDTQQSIMAISLDYGFNTAVSFSRAFKKMFGIAPVQLRRKIAPLMHHKEAVTYAYIQHINQTLVKVPVIRQLEAFHVLGRVQWGKEPSCEADHTTYDHKISFFTQVSRKNSCYKLVGHKTDQLASTPGDYVLKHIPKGYSAEFTHMGSEDVLSMTYDYIFQTWLPKTTYELADDYVIEQYMLEDNRPCIRVYVPILGLWKKHKL